MNLLGRIIMPKEVAGTHEERNNAKRRMIATSTPAMNIYLIKEAHMQRCRGPNLQIPEHIEICSYQQPTGVQASSARTANPEKKCIPRRPGSLTWEKHTAAALALRACLRTYIYLLDLYTPRPNDTVSVPPSHARPRQKVVHAAEDIRFGQCGHG